MARGIYKRTMRRAHSGTSNGSGNDIPAPLPAAVECKGATDPDSKRQDSARPLIGHTMYVDRQVARRASARSKHKQIRSLKMAIGMLVVGLVVVAMGWIHAWARFQEEQRLSAAIDTNLHKSQLMLEEIRSRLEERESDLAALVAQRLPGLSTIEYNKLLDVNDQYVLSVTFSESGVEEARTLEYYAMLLNASTRMVLPNVKIFFFDALGLQVGAAELQKDHATSDVALAELEPGETRSYHAHIQIERGATPKYYVVHVE